MLYIYLIFYQIMSTLVNAHLLGNGKNRISFCGVQARNLRIHEMGMQISDNNVHYGKEWTNVLKNI